MNYRDLDSFFGEDPRRAGSSGSDFGVWHGEGASVRAIWLRQTGELFALTLTGRGAGEVRVLAKLPRSGHPSGRRSDLIAEAALAGWAERSGRPGSLDWLERRVGELGPARLEPIDGPSPVRATAVPAGASRSARTATSGERPATAASVLAWSPGAVGPPPSWKPGCAPAAGGSPTPAPVA